ncbi:helix-turn-helix transcriptional regulator [Microbacterium esteraromaticum]|uniref:Helix-turn-helix transcriptional regulator n=1 Tax=Microbacterium esteraromaticum TaxID=57043 RepID=A0A7D7WJ08_9MICO|nr:LuxR C-terminal-related transcriptional regulator [Microbacterium esteraromaticum]QMU97650.1 helix-turn-helix transcriptional regulator [Microbacterium esteraromaticum]
MTDEHASAPGAAGSVAPDLPAAFLDAIAEGDPRAAEAAARLAWFELAGRCATPTGEALRRLDDASLEESPLLSMLAGLCELEAGRESEGALLRIARAVEAAQDDRRGVMAIDRALILSAESARHQRHGRLDEANDVARAALAHAREATTRLRSVPLSDLFTQIGVALHYTGEVDLALEAFSAGQAVAPTTPGPVDATEIAGLAAVFAYEGDIALAARYLDHARAAGAGRALTPAGAVNDWVAASMIELERFDGDGVLARLESIDTEVPFEQRLALDIVAAMARMVSGDPATALAGLEAQMRSIELHSGRSVPPSSVAFTRSMLQLSLGNVRVASAIVESDFAVGPTREVARARIELVRGHPGSAFRRLAELSTDPLPLRTAAEASAIETAALLRRRGSTRADAAIDYLGALLLRTGLRMPLAFLPHADFDRVVAGLHAAGHGALLAGLPARSVLPDLVSAEALTARERTVLSALMDSGSAADIARQLYVSPNTVKSQLRSIYRKLGAASRQEAIMIAVERQLLSPSDEADAEQDPHD